MRISRIAAAFVAALLIGCGQPLPADKSAYVGEWRGKDMSLRITKDGQVEYRRRTGGGNTTVSAPLQRFEGDNFVVGLGPFNTTFVVAKPPHLDGGVWKMTVDGVDLVRGGGDERQV
jgi:hypothetical protein